MVDAAPGSARGLAFPPSPRTAGVFAAETGEGTPSQVRCGGAPLPSRLRMPALSGYRARRRTAEDGSALPLEGSQAGLPLTGLQNRAALPQPAPSRALTPQNCLACATGAGCGTAASAKPGGTPAGWILLGRLRASELACRWTSCCSLSARLSATCARLAGTAFCLNLRRAAGNDGTACWAPYGSTLCCPWRCYARLPSHLGCKRVACPPARAYAWRRRRRRHKRARRSAWLGVITRRRSGFLRIPLQTLRAERAPLLAVVGCVGIGGYRGLQAA